MKIEYNHHPKSRTTFGELSIGDLFVVVGSPGISEDVSIKVIDYAYGFCRLSLKTYRVHEVSTTDIEVARYEQLEPLKVQKV